MQFLEYINALDGTKCIGFEKYFNMMMFLERISKNPIDKFKIDGSILLTPFYIDGGTYEIYQYELNIFLSDDQAISNQTNRINRDYLIHVKRSYPYIETNLIESYMHLLFESNDLKEEIQSIFKTDFDESKMYFALY